jgi:hypothetical protein
MDIFDPTDLHQLVVQVLVLDQAIVVDPAVMNTVVYIVPHYSYLAAILLRNQ